jgi:hypothetical protein
VPAPVARHLGSGLVVGAHPAFEPARPGDRVGEHPFGLDVGFGDPVVGEIETCSGRDYLEFAGIPAPRIRVLPLETHVAEKLHAYTLPRLRLNSRVKDLPDIALLASSRAIASSTLREALVATFDYRGSHPRPVRFVDPPREWIEPNSALAEADPLPWRGIDSLCTAVRGFLDPVLADEGCGAWDARRWEWPR